MYFKEIISAAKEYLARCSIAVVPALASATVVFIVSTLLASFITLGLPTPAAFGYIRIGTAAAFFTMYILWLFNND